MDDEKMENEYTKGFKEGFAAGFASGFKEGRNVKNESTVVPNYESRYEYCLHYPLAKLPVVNMGSDQTMMGDAINTGSAQTMMGDANIIRQQYGVGIYV